MTTPNQHLEQLDSIALDSLYQAYLRWMQEELEEAERRFSGTPAWLKLAKQNLHPLSLQDFTVSLQAMPDKERDEYIRSLRLGRQVATEEGVERIRRELEDTWVETTGRDAGNGQGPRAR